MAGGLVQIGRAIVRGMAFTAGSISVLVLIGAILTVFELVDPAVMRMTREVNSLQADLDACEESVK